MKVAISNIAWETHDDPNILKLLTDNHISGIEVAPTKLWPNWERASYKGAKEYRTIMKEQGFELPAMQAILFGKPELQLFDKTSHTKFLEHLKFVSELANGFGSQILVFGAPKNRRRGQITHSEAMNLAAEFFRKAAEICEMNDCCIGLEHNPVEYGCDFVTNVMDAKELVGLVNNKGFKLHVDSAGLHMCGGNISDMINQAGEFAHYHISEPMLEPIFGGVVAHKKCIDTLNKLHYRKWISIEMKKPSSVQILEKSLEQVKDIVSAR